MCGLYILLQVPLRMVFLGPGEITVVLLGLCTIGGLKGTLYATAGFVNHGSSSLCFRRLCIMFI